MHIKARGLGTQARDLNSRSEKLVRNKYG